MTTVIIFANLIFSFVIWKNIRKSQKKDRILQAFIAGLVRSISDYVSKTDSVNIDEIPEQNKSLPIPYKNIIEAIEYELDKDFYHTSTKSYNKWLKESRKIFTNNKSRGDGFVFINYDLFDKLISDLHSNELITIKNPGLTPQGIIRNTCVLL